MPISRPTPRGNAVKAFMSEPDEKKEYRQMSYYLTEEQIKAISLKATLSGSDKSTVVRDALDEYLKSEIETLKAMEEKN